MSEYVQGFVLPVPTKNKKAYQKLATAACAAWIQYGALDYRECFLTEDYKKDCKITFPKLAGVKKGETVVFAWITYKSKKDAERIMKKVMADARFDGMDKQPMPFDMARMTFGGFEPVVSSQTLKKSKPAKTKKKAVKAKPKKKTSKPIVVRK